MTEPSVQLSRWKRIRGEGTLWIRRTVTHPLADRISVDRLRGVHCLRRSLMPHRYTDADPFRLVSIDPHRLERSILETAPKRPQWGRVQGGDWDRRWEPFENRAVAIAIRQHFEEDVPWQETPLFTAYCDQLERFGNAWGYRSLEGFDRRCRSIEALYESIRIHGYRRQATLAGIDGAEPLSCRMDEINVDIGRDGTFYWRAYGQHRLAIAKLLDLESVPVLFHRRHRTWQARRDQYRARIEHNEGDTHPDLIRLEETK